MALKVYNHAYSSLVNILETPVLLSHYSSPPPTTEYFREYKGFWDTGSDRSMITQKAVDELGLVSDIYGFRKGTHEVVQVKLYKVILCINFRNENNMMDFALEVGTFDRHDDLDFLIGTDVIYRGDFAISTFNNRMCFSYRKPSQADIVF